jgi:hypothetical protein
MKKLVLIGSALSLIAVAPAGQAAVTTYNVSEAFNQVVYNANFPNSDTIFTGSFTFDSVTKTVSNLTGSLSQAMSFPKTGIETFRPLSYQLSSVYDATLGGLVVTSFFQNSTDVFTGGGYAKGGTTTYGNQNAYATIFVNTSDPTAALTSAQIDTLAYADCTTGGLMGTSKCMTGWVDHAKVNLAGGTMQGTYPITQSITAAVPEPETYAMMMAGLGLVGFMARRRRTA